MPRKIKSRPKPFHNAPKGNSKRTGGKKTIVCHCWPGVYEAAYRILNDYSNDKLNGEKISMSEFINILISAAHMHLFKTFPDFGEDNQVFQKGEN